ncbi:hypothetical protein C8R44DRAFT_750832 [Mycena epipterygia]|nr:hypothetical protein C8R44DRAFT_750832 [Mycena epipterygia]
MGTSTAARRRISDRIMIGREEQVGPEFVSAERSYLDLRTAEAKRWERPEEKHRRLPPVRGFAKEKEANGASAEILNGISWWLFIFIAVLRDRSSTARHPAAQWEIWVHFRNFYKLLLNHGIHLDCSQSFRSSQYGEVRQPIEMQFSSVQFRTRRKLRARAVRPRVQKQRIRGEKKMQIDQKEMRQSKVNKSRPFRYRNMGDIVCKNYGHFTGFLKTGYKGIYAFG